jgi:hypothetical protein
MPNAQNQRRAATDLGKKRRFPSPDGCILLLTGFGSFTQLNFLRKLYAITY